ncbi:MAG: DUF1178 family protein [Candidimonas sp.]
MIKYRLKCLNDHVVDSWFADSDTYDRLHKAGMVMCEICGQAAEKTLMAPSVKSSFDDIKMDDVGEKFTDEALAMFYGEKEARNIKGVVSKDDCERLDDHGVPYQLLSKTQ